MKDNKFRGIRIDNGEWVYGDLLEPFESHYYVLDYSKFNYDCFEDIGEFGEDFEVIPETVGQLIGLKDINLKELYEDDYVKAYDALTKCNFKGYISFANGSFVIVGDNGIIHYRWYDYSIEKIGDIHTNPGLLEVIPDE